MDKNLKDFLIKFGLFALLLVIVRALFQTPIEYFSWKMLYESYSNRVFSKGDATKVIALVGVLFTLYCRNKISTIAHPKIQWLRSVLFFFISLVVVAGYLLLRYITNFYSITSGYMLYLILLLKFLDLALACFLIFIAVFQMQYSRNLSKALWKELLIAGVFSIAFYFILMYFQDQWRFFSEIVSSVLYSMFSQFFSADYVIRNGTPFLTVENFTVAIGSSCSGIDSMLLFFALFSVIFVLDYKDLKKVPYIISFILGFIGVFFVNNLRIFLLILVGLYISPKIAVGLFHTNAGWVLFIIYFVIYYKFMKRFIYHKNLAKHAIKQSEVEKKNE